MGDLPANPPRKSRWLLPACLAVVVIAAAVMAVAFRRVDQPAAQKPDAKPAETKLARADSVKLLSLRDQAVGRLENLNFEEAEQLLLEIIRLLPDDPFGPRNLTICRDLAIEKIDPGQRVEKMSDAIAKAGEALELLNRVEPDSPVNHVLAARVAVKQGDLDRAASELRRATALSPSSAPAWYDLFTLRPLTPGEPPAKETVDALRKVYELEPDNLFVLKDWLPLQTQLKEPALAETLQQARKTLDPFAEVIKTNIRIDVRDMLDKLAKAVAEEKWPVATSTAMTIRNVIVSEAARDERYVRWNSLEYALQDFGKSFYLRADLPDLQEPAIPVTFRTADEQQSTRIGAARDLVVADFNLDFQMDSAAVVDQQIVITMPAFSKSADDAISRITLSCGDGFEQVVAVDLDDDVDLKTKDPSKCFPSADPDLIVFGPAGIKLYENRASAPGTERQFVNRPTDDAMNSLTNVRAVIPGDYDLDGDLDLLTLAKDGVRFWSNRGNWTFEDITSRSKLPPAEFSPTAAVAVDWDRDVDLDVLIAGVDGFGILESMRHGRFRWRPLDGEFHALKNAKSLLVEQTGHGVSWSVIGAGPQGMHSVLTQTSAAGLVSGRSTVEITRSSVERCQSLDFDNDGVRDVLAVSASSLSLFRGLANEKYEDVAPGLLKESGDVTSFGICDIDRDGDEDLLIGTKGESAWRINDGGNANGWLNVSLAAIQIKPNEQNYSKRVNHWGIGSVIEVKAGQRYQAQVVQPSMTHFGLGSLKQADAVRVLWTNGLPQNRIAPEANQFICEEQKLLGSCPYLYTWDGEKFTFFTDLLWNAPLGLKFAENVVAPWREWEYLKIDGDRLRPDKGRYQLRVTAELWEVEYFDQIQLFAVDHPAGTEVHTNEKVGPASLASPRIHTVSKPHSPIAARDPHGRDILEQVKSKDGNYTRTYDHKVAQGLTNQHFLELDLGAWPGQPADSATAPVVTLFLTGWMYPGSTSLRVQHSQNPDLQQPRPPALHAIGSDGQWHEVRPFMGFPGGKTKTIAVDISDVFAPGSTDHRLRIVTNMEFYWDSVFFTVNDPAVEHQQTKLSLVRAQLVDRGGVSLQSWPVSGNGPDQFDYQQLVPGDAWPPIEGAFTRFGDVLPLVTARDDQLVVMHPGDEIQLDFAVPDQDIPAGWVRDFVLYDVGWDKDCDQHTVYGETSEPLPFEAMTEYAYKDGAGRPMDDAYATYLNTYQTRTRPRGPFWNQVRRR